MRRQTTRQEGTIETQVLDYSNQQNNLFPLIATAFALHFTGQYMMNLYTTFQKNQQSGDLSTLPEVHATSSGLKGLVTALASEGIEVCRLACGGHGYHHYRYGADMLLGNVEEGTDSRHAVGATAGELAAVCRSCTKTTSPRAPTRYAPWRARAPARSHRPSANTPYDFHLCATGA